MEIIPFFAALDKFVQYSASFLNNNKFKSYNNTQMLNQCWCDDARGVDVRRHIAEKQKLTNRDGVENSKHSVCCSLVLI